MSSKIIKTIRLVHELTTTEFAKILGITRQTYNYREAGKGNFTVADYKKISEIFDIDLVTLMSASDVEIKYVFKNENGDVIHENRKS